MAAGLLNVAAGLIGDALAPYALISSPIRAISYIIPHVVIEEQHTDDLAVTDHPVETGAAISDHAFKLPARVEMRCGWSNSTAEAEGFVQEINAALLSLQAQREPFTVYTGKRVYQNMLLGRIAVVTSAEAENTLLVSIGLREVIRTQTQMTSAAQSAQAMPEKTGSVSETGTTAAVGAPGSSSFGLSGPTGPGDLTIGTAPGGGGFSTGGVIGSTAISGGLGGGSFGLDGISGTGALVGNAPGGGSFGISGPSGAAPFRI